MPRRAPDTRRARGLLDTSVVIALETIEVHLLPREAAVSAITMAELSAGPHATSSPDERARCQDRLQRAEAAFGPLPFDLGAARAYGRVYAAITGHGRKPRGTRAVDLLNAAVALGNDIPLFTRNAADFAGLEHLVDVVDV
jgi:predicted nucleic acid-binding protein